MGVKMNSGGFRMVGAGKSTLDGGPVSPRKAEAGANVKGAQAKVPKYASGGSVHCTTGSSRVVSGMKNGGRAKK